MLQLIKHPVLICNGDLPGGAGRIGVAPRI